MRRLLKRGAVGQCCSRRAGAGLRCINAVLRQGVVPDTPIRALARGRGTDGGAWRSSPRRSDAALFVATSTPTLMATKRGPSLRRGTSEVQHASLRQIKAARACGTESRNDPVFTEENRDTPHQGAAHEDPYRRRR